MPIITEVWRNTYYDSVTLMLGSSMMEALPGIDEAMVLMGTDRNDTVIRASGLLADGCGEFGSNDIVIGMRADSEQAARDAIAELERFLTSKKGSGNRKAAAHTLDGALREDPGIDLAMISVPGRYARAEAEKALDAGLHVMLFSDNVALEDEIALKDRALEKGLLMMGPDCGTAIVNGCALGFANVVRRGNIGLVGAAGTGLQEITVLIDRLGGGVSQALGTGGRDLKEDVGGRMMDLCLEALRDDLATEVIAILSKPPHPSVVEKMKRIISTIEKPVVACFLGSDADALAGTHAVFAKDCEECARIAVRLSGVGLPEKDEAWIAGTAAREAALLAPGQRWLRGLYSGGTLCYEAMLAFRDAGIPAYSNIAIDADLLLDDPDVSCEHTLVDMGEDFFTNGMPHPMIDLRMRVERIARDCAQPDVAILLLDCVGGYGTNDDPAGALAPAIIAAKDAAAAEGRHLCNIASVTASEADPQVRSAQEQTLRSAGAIVCDCNAQAVRLAFAILDRLDTAEPVAENRVNALFASRLAIANVGVDLFAEAFRAQETPCVQVEWKPPAGGNKKMADLLSKLKDL